MLEHMREYFAAEKLEAAVFMLVGLAAIGVSAWLIRTGNAYKGMIYPLLIVALIQLSVGGSVFFRTDDQVERLTGMLAENPAEFKKSELERMASVVKGFKTYKIIEIILLLGGIVLTFVFQKNMTLYAAGIGLIIQAAVTLVLDLFAEKRADLYVEQINQLL